MPIGSIISRIFKPNQPTSAEMVQSNPDIPKHVKVQVAIAQGQNPHDPRDIRSMRYLQLHSGNL